jgi:AcrR family transcriptional regulator
MTARGEETRNRLLDAAERLLAERGVFGASLREVNAAAGQRNNAALHFHFGGRDGLVRAIAERHLPRIEARQQELFDVAERDGCLGDVRTLVAIIVRPSAEYVAAGPRERAWLRIATELGTRPETASEVITTAASAAAWSAGTHLLEHLTSECGMSRDDAVERVWMVMDIVMQAVARRARFEDAETRRSAPPHDVFVEDLLDVTCAAVTAPVSEQTHQVRGHSSASLQ